jgi:hypothetical protein
MKNSKIYGKMTFAITLVVLFLCFSGKEELSAENGANSSAQSRAATVLTYVEKELDDYQVLVWEEEVTDTSIANVVGYIIRGKTNLNISGIITNADITTIQRSINSAINKKPQLFRLDFSSASFETKIDGENGLSIDTNGLGSITLPKGIEDVRIGLYDGTPFLLDVNLPVDTGTKKLTIIGAFTKIVVPSNVQNISVRSSNNFVAILNDGMKTVELTSDYGDTAFSYNSATRWNWRTQNPLYTLVLPSSLSQFTGHSNACEEIYSYASIPPVAGDNNQNQFPNLKTVYVPAGSEKAYGDAWFNYTGAEFKPLPADFQTIEQLSANWRPAQNSLGLSITREDK